MKKSLTFIFFIVVFLTACKQKRVESTTYGDFRYEVTTWERKKFFWPGMDHLDSKFRIYYKGEEVDFEKLATDYLKEKTDFMEPLELSAAVPTFFHCNEALYCELYAGYHSTIGVLTTNKEGLVFIPLINKILDSSIEPYFSIYQMDSIGDQKVWITNYLIHEQPFRVLAKTDRIFRKYDNYTGDTAVTCEASRYYGMSPDDKILVRSFDKDMFGYPELCNLFVTELSTGKTTEFPLMKSDTARVDFYNVHQDSVYQVWFKKNFEWTSDQGSYKLNIKAAKK